MATSNLNSQSIPVLNSYPPTGIGMRRRSKQVRLTGREFAILKLVAEGYESRETADMLFVSKRTIDFHLSSIYRKLQVDNRIRALTAARRLGILASDY